MGTADLHADDLVVTETKQQRLRRWAEATKAVVITHYLPLSFAVALTVALAWPAPGLAALRVTILGDVHILQEVGMGIVFFISGLTLNTNELYKVRGNIWAVLFGFLSILFISPCLGFVLREIPLEPQEFTIGLVIFCVVPTTLGVGVALVRSCKGNEAVALLLTVGTNMLGVFTMPLLLKLLFLNFDTGLAFSVDIPNLLVKLLITILVPSVIGKVLREVWPAARVWIDGHKIHLSLLSTTCLALIIWMTLSGARDLLFAAQGGMIAAVLVLGASIHVFYLAANYVVVCYLFKADIAEAVALVIVAAQKSAPVAVTLISYATPNLSQQGLLAIPSIVGQLSQIFIGAALVPAVLKRVKAAAAKASEQLELQELPPAVTSDLSDQAPGGSPKGSDGGAGRCQDGVPATEYQSSSSAPARCVDGSIRLDLAAGRQSGQGGSSAQIQGDTGMQVRPGLPPDVEAGEIGRQEQRAISVQ